MLVFLKVCKIYLLMCVLYIVVNKEEPELAIATEENQDEEPTKAKKRKYVMCLLPYLMLQ